MNVLSICNHKNNTDLFSQDDITVMGLSRETAELPPSCSLTVPSQQDRGENRKRK